MRSMLQSHVLSLQNDTSIQHRSTRIVGYKNSHSVCIHTRVVTKIYNVNLDPSSAEQKG